MLEKLEKVILQPVEMVTPTQDGVYAPSKNLPEKVVPVETFVNEYADTGEQMSVSFEPDGTSNPQVVTSYYQRPSPMDGRFIVSDSSG